MRHDEQSFWLTQMGSALFVVTTIFLCRVAGAEFEPGAVDFIVGFFAGYFGSMVLSFFIRIIYLWRKHAKSRP